MPVSLRRETVPSEQTLFGQRKGPGEGGGAVVDHAGSAETERFQGAAAEPGGASQSKRGQAG